MADYETIVGLEIHVELKTVSKMFCGCKNDPFHAPKPNIYTCPVCLGMPGGLPVPNKKAVESTIRLGLALGSEIAVLSKFDRKNYFYPDIPKGYQISQYDQPLCRGGLVKTELGDVRIHRVHLEEDTGKLQHTTLEGLTSPQGLRGASKKVSLVDFNRSGVPLVEIVTEADIRTGDQAKIFLKKLHSIIQSLGISDADMEKGTMRIEPNISVRRVTGDKEQALPNYKVEVKNINSFNFVKKAIEFETKRHIEMLEKGETPVQETRGWNEDKNMTFPQRRKETADDYRYFPEPDIPPLKWDKSDVDALRRTLPEMPDEKRIRFMKEFGLTAYDATILLDEPSVTAYFEEAVRASAGQKDITPKKLANMIINKKIDVHAVRPQDLVKQLSSLSQVSNLSDEDLVALVQSVLAAQPKAIEDYKAGKEQSLMFLLGQVMKAGGGTVSASQVKEKLMSMLK
jgi:aspartyl-tRNA(Asn)/glutamyl-tRNA(Gln) amidotransferase subunit B